GFVAAFIVGLRNHWWPAFVLCGLCIVGFVFTIRLAFWGKLKMWSRWLGGEADGGRGVLRPGPGEQPQATQEPETGQLLPQTDHRFPRARAFLARRPRSKKSGSD